MFQFIIGAKQIPMMIHSALVAEQSHDLESLVNGSMQEASSGIVIWEDVGKEISARYAQFVYTGDYDTPLHTTMGYPSQLPPLDQAEEEPDSAEDPAWPKGGWNVPESNPKTLFKSKKTPKYFELSYHHRLCQTRSIYGRNHAKTKAQKRITVQSF